MDNNHFTYSGLTFNKCERQYGGYCVIGKLVIIEMGLKFTDEPTQWDAIISGLPDSRISTAYYEVPMHAIVNNGAGTDSGNLLFSIDVSGTRMRRANGSSVTYNGRYVNISGVYVSA